MVQDFVNFSLRIGYLIKKKIKLTDRFHTQYSTIFPAVAGVFKNILQTHVIYFPVCMMC